MIVIAGRRLANRGRQAAATTIAVANAVLAGACQIPASDLGLHSDAAVNVHSVPVAVVTQSRFHDLAAGYLHVCGILPIGTIECWGSDEYQQLGAVTGLTLCDHGATACSPMPLTVEATTPFTHVAASLRHSCAVDVAGQGWCWGYGVGGALGNGLATSSDTAVPVASATPFSEIVLGGTGLISCGLTTARVAVCWGAGGGGGGLGDGTTAGSDAPVPVSGGLEFHTLAVGDEHACGLVASGAAYCWGHDHYGALGTGVPGASSVPLPVAGGLSFTALSAGLAHTCGLGVDGRAYCWGFPPSVGSIVSGQVVLTPTAVAGDHAFTLLSAGGNATCALEADGSAWCWGQNGGGVLGDGTQVDRPQPVRVRTTVPFVLIRVGGVQACALDAGGVAYCWGLNTFGSVGQPPDGGS